MTRAEIKTLTEAKIDEITPFSAGEINAVSLIEELMDEACRDLLKSAPRHVLRPASLDVSGLIWNVDGTGRVPLPADYLRLYDFKMHEWERPCANPITVDDPRYKFQLNKYTRGGKCKPVLVYYFDNEFKSFALKYFSVQSDHTVDYAQYIQDQKPENIDNKLIDPLTWLLAMNVLMIMGRDQTVISIAKTRYEEWILKHAVTL